MFEKILGPEVGEALQPLVDKLESYKDEELTPTTIANMSNVFMTSMQANADTTIKQARDSFRQQNLTREQAIEFVDGVAAALKKEVDDMHCSCQARTEVYYSLIDAITYGFYKAADILDNADATVKWKLMNENAKIPTYAYETDACADVYASEDITIPKHSCGTAVHTGLQAIIPKGWFLEIRARSGLSMRTPIRLSNSVGTIDEGYRGEIMVLFDNISGKDYEIKAGDRIAQIRLEPAYQFRSETVTEVGESDRGAGGFGSTGK